MPYASDYAIRLAQIERMFASNGVTISTIEIKSRIRAINNAIKNWDGPNNDDYFDLFERRKKLKYELARRWHKSA